MGAVGTTVGVAPLHLSVMGVTVEVEVPDQETRERLAHQWSRALVEAPGPAVGPVRAPAGPSETSPARDYVLTTQVTVAGLQATAGVRLNLHAGGLADDRGRVLALVGPSGTGKTTATRTLAGRLGYLSDETVSIDAEGRVFPHAKPLSVVIDPGRPWEKAQVSPDDLGLLPTPSYGALARLVVLQRGAEGERGLVRLDPAEALLELIEQTSSLALVPDPLTRVLDVMANCGGVYALRYTEIEDHVDDLVDLLATEPDTYVDADPAPVTHPGSRDLGVSEAPDGDLLARLPWVDAVELDHSIVVLTGARAWLLADLTATLWLHLAEPRTLADLVEEAQRVHGDHPDAHAIVDEAVATLLEEELVTRGALA
jgi:hypothetical protein